MKLMLIALTVMCETQLITHLYNEGSIFSRFTYFCYAPVANAMKCRIITEN